MFALKYGSADYKSLKETWYVHINYPCPGEFYREDYGFVMYASIDIMSSIFGNTLHSGAFSISMLLAWTSFDKAVQMPVI